MQRERDEKEGGHAAQKDGEMGTTKRKQRGKRVHDRDRRKKRVYRTRMCLPICEVNIVIFVISTTPIVLFLVPFFQSVIVTFLTQKTVLQSQQLSRCENRAKLSKRLANTALSCVLYFINIDYRNSIFISEIFVKLSKEFEILAEQNIFFNMCCSFERASA